MSGGNVLSSVMVHLFVSHLSYKKKLLKNLPTNIKRIYSVPSLRAEFPPFSDNGVEIAQSKEDALEVSFLIAHV